MGFVQREIAEGSCSATEHCAMVLLLLLSLLKQELLGVMATKQWDKLRY